MIRKRITLSMYKLQANRRRMNVESEIARPASQQCAIVGIPKNSKNYSEWAEFMNPDCN